jgi:hypothetical protein
MPSHPILESSVVAICDANRRIVGTGFLAEGDLILTCAHVIEAAGSGRDGTVQVMFRGEHEPLLRNPVDGLCP